MEINKLKEIASYALSKAKEMGADDAQCRVRYSVTDEINIDAGEFSLMRSTFDNSLTINVIKDMKKGTIAINKLDKASIDAAAKECVEAAEVSAVDDCLSIAPVIDNKDFSEGVLESDRDKFFDRIEEYATDIKEQFPKVFIEQLIADFYESKSVFANTNGVEFSNRVAYYSAGAMYSAHDGDKTTSFNSNGVDFYNLDEKIIDKGMQKQMYKLCEKELEAEPFEGKFTGKAIFAPSCVTDIVGTAISNFTSDGALIEGTTPWKDMLHKKVASDSLTVSAIPLDKRVVGGESENSRSMISRVV